MLELKRIRESSDELVKALEKRGFRDAGNTILQVLDLDRERRDVQQRHDELLSESNQLSRQIGELMREGKKVEADQVKERTGELKERIKSLGEDLKSVETQLEELLYKIPNAPHKLVPAGTSEKDNEEVYSWGDAGSRPSQPKPHWEIAAELGIIDFELGNKITGAGFPVYLGKGARLQRALIQFFLDEASASGYQEVLPPILINEDSGYGTGQLPDKDGQMYHMTEDNLFLIPTAEVPITNMFRDEIIDEDRMPVKCAGYTPCFRREAGSWGAHVRGLNRLHQFDKVEIVQIVQPDRSYQVLDEMLAHVKGLLEKLELPYRMLRLCGGDLGFTSAMTIDFEVLAKGQDKWLEVSSVSNFETFQTNRMKCRFRNADKKVSLAHSLNGSALALPRIVAAILENNYEEKGVRIPKALVPYTGFELLDQV